MRPVLVLVDGLPGSGKSTVVRQWCERDPAGLALGLDVDAVRAVLGRWPDAGAAAGLAARRIATAAAEAHLSSGHDVLVPQYLERDDFVDELADTADRAGAAFLELVVQVDPATAARRFAARAVVGHRAEGELEAPMEELAVRFSRFLAGRPRAVRLDGGHADLLDRLDRAILRARST